MSRTTRPAAVILLGAVLAVLAGTNVDAADKKTDACALLTAAEIADALAGAVGQPKPFEIVIADGPSKGETMGGCDWKSGSGSLNVAVIRAPAGTRESRLAQFKQIFEMLKSQGFIETIKEFGNGTCGFMTPPKGRKDLPTSTGCFGEARGTAISVGFNGTSTVPMDSVKALYDKALGRLP